jgi:hypothetical protein
MLSKGKVLMNKAQTADTVAVATVEDSSLEIDSVVLRRLIEEVRTSEPLLTGAYDRTYNRHNR